MDFILQVNYKNAQCEQQLFSEIQRWIGLPLANGTEGGNETTSFERLYYISPEHFDVMFIDLASRSVLKVKKCVKMQIKSAQTTYKMRLNLGP